MSSTDLMQLLLSRFDASAAESIDEVFQLCITDEADYHIIIHDKQCAIVDGEHSDPSVVLTASITDFTDLMNGELDGMAAFMMGKLQVSGDMLLATKLTELFPH